MNLDDFFIFFAYFISLFNYTFFYQVV